MIRELWPHTAAMIESDHNDAPSEGAVLVTAEGEMLPSDPRRITHSPIEPPLPGESVAITERIRWGRIPLPIDLNHINVWLIDDDDGYIAVDTGMAPSICKDAWEQIGRDLFARKPLKGVFVTHLHPDHIGLARWLQERHRVPVWMSSRAHESARALFGGSGPDSREVESFLLMHGVPQPISVQPLFKPERFVRMTSGLPEVERHIGDGERLDWAGDEWIAMRTDGHAEGHLCLWNRTANLLISGDQVLPTISSNISIMIRQQDANPLASYLSSLERLRTLPANTLVLPSHGVLFYGLQPRIDDLRAHHEAQLAKLMHACTAPMSAYEVLPVLFRRELGGMHLFLALGEAIAHLEYLAQQGELNREQQSNAVRYVRGK